MSFVSFIDGGQHRFVDPEAEGGGDEGERQVANHTAHNVHLIAAGNFSFVLLLL